MATQQLTDQLKAAYKDMPEKELKSLANDIEDALSLWGSIHKQRGFLLRKGHKVDDTIMDILAKGERQCLNSQRQTMTPEKGA